MKIKKWLLKDKLLKVVLLIAVLLNFIGLIPNVKHPDEPPLHEYSAQLAVNILTNRDFDPHTFKYGTINYFFHAFADIPIIVVGYLFHSFNILLSSSFIAKPLALGVYAQSALISHKEIFFWLGRAVTASFGVGSVWILYLLTKELFDKKVGLLAAFLMAISPLHVRESHYITTDIPANFFILLALYFLAKLMKSKDWKWYILSGLSLGVGGAIRYFPVAVLAYPVAAIFAMKDNDRWFTKSIIGGIFIILGFFIGVPFLFLKPDGPALFMEDLWKYALPWYSTPISTYVFSLGEYIFSGGQNTLPPLSSLIPTRAFRPALASFIFYSGYGIIPSLFGVLGGVILFFKKTREFLLIVVAPLVVFIYTGYYLNATYDRLILPVIPFLAICGAWLIKHGANNSKKVLIFLIFVVCAFPLVRSVNASVQCGETSIYDKSEKFIQENINPEAVVTHLPPVSFPSSPEFNSLELIEMFPENLLSLEESVNSGAEYTFLNLQRLDYNTYEYFNNYFTVPGQIYSNSYLSLIFKEYVSRSKLLGSISKDSMCERSRVYYFALPRMDSANPVSVGIDAHDSSYVMNGKEAVPPRLILAKLPIEEGVAYSSSLQIRKNGSDRDVDSFPKMYLRMDFYSPEKSFFEKIKTNLKKKILFLAEGSTPIYFEKEILFYPESSDINYPGTSVALSTRVVPEDDYKKIEVIATAPKNTQYLVVSLQSDSVAPADFDFTSDINQTN